MADSLLDPLHLFLALIKLNFGDQLDELQVVGMCDRNILSSRAQLRNFAIRQVSLESWLFQQVGKNGIELFWLQSITLLLKVFQDLVRVGIEVHEIAH